MEQVSVKLTKEELELLSDAINMIRNIQLSGMRFNQGVLNDEVYAKYQELDKAYGNINHKLWTSPLVQG
jgi:hypothetical protein